MWVRGGRGTSNENADLYCVLCLYICTPFQWYSGIRYMQIHVVKLLDSLLKVAVHGVVESLEHLVIFDLNVCSLLDQQAEKVNIPFSSSNHQGGTAG